jgi:hypothetical protein
MLSFTALKYKNKGSASPKSSVDIQSNIAVIKKDLGNIQVRINVLDGIAIICCCYYYYYYYYYYYTY